MGEPTMETSVFTAGKSFFVVKMKALLLSRVQLHFGRAFRKCWEHTRWVENTMCFEAKWRRVLCREALNILCICGPMGGNGPEVHEG